MSRAKGIVILVCLVIGMARVQAQEATAPSLEHARALYDAGNLADARQDLEALVKAGTQDPQVFLLLGVIERTEGRLGRAITSLQQAHALAPDAAPMAVELASTLAWNRNLDRAIALFRSVLLNAPDDAGARGGLAFALAWQGHLEEARALFVAMTEQDARNVTAWLGIGFVDRASFRAAQAAEAYHRVLAIDPTNAEAKTALEDLRWDRRSETRVLAGFGANPNTSARPEARVDTVYALAPRVTLAGGYQHYAFGAISPVTGSIGIREEDSFEGGVAYRPSNRLALAANLYTFFASDIARGTLWAEAVFSLTPRISLIGNLRPAFSDRDPSWLWAGAGGAAVALPHQQQLTARMLIAANTIYEPRATLLVNYDGRFSRSVRARVGVAHSSTEERFEFTSVSAGVTYLVAPSFGLTAEAGRRMGTARRSELLVGVIVRH